MQRYNPKDIEPKWQKIWDETGIYTTDLHSDRPKYVAMSMFNYPSGAGIHIGHAMNYTISDVKARFKRQQGFESYHPVGWDAFGLPAENYAIKTGVSPQESMATIIPSYHKQYKAMGWSNDWEKEIATHLPEYYKWTQWIFAQMFKAGLAYQDSRLQWWCPIDNTVLANEQVIDGKCWRHDGPNDPPAEKREVKQWFFKITDYADELLDAIDGLDWTESVKLAQKNWIGKSTGAEIEFGLDFGNPGVNATVGPDGKKPHVTVFTTRPDTIFGATFLILAPEHPWVTVALERDDVFKNKEEVAAYVEASKRKSELERQESKEKTGVEIKGVTAVNPVNGESIPIWLADYVLSSYGTGAIMAVPAHDERDHDFATKFGLLSIETVSPYIMLSGINAVRKDTEILDRKVVDAIIINKEGKYLLQVEADNTHFVGGGVEPEDADDEAALRREILEEVGFTDIENVRLVSSKITTLGYRITKQKNQRYEGTFYEVRLASDKQVASEIEEGKHSIKWVDKAEVADMLTWEGHAFAWQQYLAGNCCYHDEGIMINSGEYDRLRSAEAREEIVADLAQKGLAKEKINYKMRDWSVSRQRYWGAPIPIIDCPKCGPQLVPDEELPVVLPELDDFQPSGDGRSALARAKDWLEVDCPKCGGRAERETDTLDTYICSSWYMYRYLDPHNQQAIFDSEVAKKWEPIDFYNGADHATAHLLYARFMARFFVSLGLINEPEPFKQFLFNGKVTAADGTMFSKSKGNGVDPLEIIAQGYGADALRTYLMFASPLDLWTRWDSQGVPGSYRFLNRLWNLVGEYVDAQPAELSDTQQLTLRRITHRTIKKMTEDIEANHYNTAIAAAMTCINDLYKLKTTSFGKHEAWQETLQSIVACVAPFAPHLSEELWRQLGHSDSVHRDSWPTYDEQYLTEDNTTIAVQINGKVRGQIMLPTDANEISALDTAKAEAKIQTYLTGKQIVKTIYVPGKILNLVVK